MSQGTAAFTLVEKDLKPNFDVVLQEELENGTIQPVDLTSFTDIVLRVRRQDGSRFERDAVIDDAAEGEFHFEWQAGDLVPGLHEAEITFTDAIGDETFPDDKPMQLVIRERV